MTQSDENPWKVIPCSWQISFTIFISCLLLHSILYLRFPDAFRKDLFHSQVDHRPLSLLLPHLSIFPDLQPLEQSFPALDAGGRGDVSFGVIRIEFRSISLCTDMLEPVIGWRRIPGSGIRRPARLRLSPSPRADGNSPRAVPGSPGKPTPCWDQTACPCFHT